jgi:hypothetical protein
MRDDLTARVEAGVFCDRDAEDFYAEAAAAMGLDAPGVPQAARDFVRRMAEALSVDHGQGMSGVAFEGAWYAYQSVADDVLAILGECRS